jgi:hypothetical protein
VPLGCGLTLEEQGERAGRGRGRRAGGGGRTEDFAIDVPTPLESAIDPTDRRSSSRPVGWAKTRAGGNRAWGGCWSPGGRPRGSRSKRSRPLGATRDARDGPRGKRGPSESRARRSRILRRAWEASYVLPRTSGGPSHRSASARSGASHVVRRRAATLSSCLLRAMDHPAYKPNPGRSAATTSATPLRPAVGLGLRGAQPHTPAYGESAPCVRAEAGASRELLSASRRATARAFLLHRRKTDAEHFPSGGIRRAGDRESARFLERAESPDGLRPAETVDGDMGTQAVENLLHDCHKPLVIHEGIMFILMGAFIIIFMGVFVGDGGAGAARLRGEGTDVRIIARALRQEARTVEDGTSQRSDAISSQSVQHAFFVISWRFQARAPRRRREETAKKRPSWVARNP